MLHLGRKKAVLKTGNFSSSFFHGRNRFFSKKLLRYKNRFQFWETKFIRRVRYVREIEESEEDIRSLSKASWKDIVKRAVRNSTKSANQKHQTFHLTPSSNNRSTSAHSTHQELVCISKSEQACTMWRLTGSFGYRTKHFVICEQAVETIWARSKRMHQPTKVCRSEVIIEDIYNQSPENIATILSRVEHFELSVTERDTGSLKSSRKFSGHLFECWDLWHTNYKNQRPCLVLLHSA